MCILGGGRADRFPHHLKLVPRGATPRIPLGDERGRSAVSSPGNGRMRRTQAQVRTDS